MPLSESDYREPAWIRHRVGYTIAGVHDRKARFMDFSQHPRSYRNGEFKQPGYNPNHQSVRVERSNLERDDLTFKPR
jgi:hypothetical protein